ncbi:MAG: hypothetical protein HYZ53_19230 [Planctomycetes bacterium]|nr:hypothetical protein [Planctomycetota bacterium]
MTNVRLETALPADNAAARRAVYEGVVFQLEPTPATQRLVADVLALLEAELGAGGPIREAQFRFSAEELFARVGRMRKRLYTEPRFHAALGDVLASAGFDRRVNAFDPLRLRVVAHEGHTNPKAAPVYYAHRDTWYANPQCQITWWIALHDVAPEETFVFFPEFLRRPVENDSARFDYEEWVRGGWGRKIGWQDPNAGRELLYPGLRGGLTDPGEPLSFSARAGELLLFAGAHLHQTRPNVSGRTRFSLDFRTAHLGDDAAGLGAPNVDNRSRGAAVRDYVHP